MLMLKRMSQRRLARARPVDGLDPFPSDSLPCVDPLLYVPNLVWLSWCKPDLCRNTPDCKWVWLRVEIRKAPMMYFTVLVNDWMCWARSLLYPDCLITCTLHSMTCWRKLDHPDVAIKEEDPVTRGDGDRSPDKQWHEQEDTRNPPSANYIMK